MNEADQKIITIAPGLYKEGNEYSYNPRIAVPEGMRRGISFLRDTLKKRQNHFDEAWLSQLHKQMLYYFPGVAGEYRLQENVAIKGYREMSDGSFETCSYNLVRGRQLRDRMPIFGRWLEERVEVLKDQQNDIIGALKLASEAHYLLVSPLLHPFYDGNGRLGRILANAILMVNAHEVVRYGMNVLPVPLMRQNTGSIKKPDGYSRILTRINDMPTPILDQFDVFLAELWKKNLTEEVEQYTILCQQRHGNGKIHPSDINLIQKFKRRIEVLNNFCEEQKSNSQQHVVPDLF